MDKALKISPKNLMADWGDFESWQDGDSSTPDGWTLAGTGAAVAKESTNIKFGLYAAKLTYGSATAQLYQDLTDYTDYLGATMKAGVWIKTSTASIARITIDDGAGTSNSSYHTGGGGWEFLEIERQIDPIATQIRIIVEVTGIGFAYFDGLILAETDILFTDLSDYIEDWRPDVGLRQPNYIIGRREGLHIPKTILGERDIKIKCSITGSTFTICRTNFDNLMKAIQSWKEDEQKDLYLYDDRVMEVFLSGGVSWEYLASMRMIRFTLTFRAPLPSMRYISKLRKKQVISSSPTSFNLEMNGNLYTRPKVTFIADQGGDISSCALENLTTQENFSFTGTVTSTKSLVVDSNNLTVENDNVDAISSFAGEFIRLIPGTNYLKFTGSLCTIKIDWFDRWI